MKGFFETLFIAAALAFTGWLIINAGMKFEVKWKGVAYGFTIGGSEESILNKNLRYSNDNTRGWGMIHYNKTPSRDKILNEIIPNSLGNRIFGWDSIYITQIPPISEELNTEYTVTSENFIVFLFFSANRKQTSAKGFVFDPEGKDRLKYLCSIDSTIYTIWN